MYAKEMLRPWKFSNLRREPQICDSPFSTGVLRMKQLIRAKEN